MKIKAEDCYLCQKTKPQFFFKKLGYSILRCPNCKLLSLDFQTNYQSFIESYYQEGYFAGDPKIRAYENYAQEKVNIIKNAQKIFKTIRLYKKSGNLLDVGCAMGFFLEEAEQNNFKAYGVEISEYAAQVAQKKFGNRIYIGSVENFLTNQRSKDMFKNLYFDIIILSDFIEHVNDPRKILKDLRKIIKKDGIIIIQTGDADSLWARLMGKNWHFFAPPQHLYFFSKSTLTKLLSQAGYKVVRMDKEGKQVSLKYLMYMSQYMNILLIGDKLIKAINNTPLEKVSLNIKLFDNMVVYAKKS